MPCRERLSMESLFSGYWEGIRVRGYGRKRKRREQRGKKREGRESEAASSEEEWTMREKGRDIGDQLALAGRGRFRVGRVCLLKGPGYPGDMAGQHNYNNDKLFITTCSHNNLLKQWHS